MRTYAVCILIYIAAFLSMLHATFGFDWSMGFREEDLLKVWKMDRQWMDGRLMHTSGHLLQLYVCMVGSTFIFLF